MRCIKLTVFSRSPDVLYNYNKSGRSFWDDLRGLLQQKHGELAVEKRSNFQAFFYLPFPENDAAAVAEVSDLIASLGTDAKSFLISSAEMRSADFESLQKNHADQVAGKEWFRAALKSMPETENTRPAPQPAEQKAAPAETAPQEEKGRPREEEKKERQEERKSPARETAPEAGNDLAEEARRISELRTTLLQKVFGQRHAVEEVVQTIFECDAFNRMNEKRNGPLASFLFVGPSGVGKTYLARLCAEQFDCEPLVVDMSEYSGNLANDKFNGEHGSPAVVTSYVRKNPHGVIIFDEIEKAHLNTIHLFLQILEPGTLMDMKTNKEVSFRDTIIFITTNAGSSLYDDPTVVDLSHVSRSTILEALRTDIKPGTNDEPFFPACITTRFANGHVILFNHLEPFSLMQIVRSELEKQIGFFRDAYGVEVAYDPDRLAALVLYSTGGTADARSLRGTAKNMIVKELQDVVMQAYRSAGDGVNQLKRVTITVEPDRCEQEVKTLFEGHGAAQVPVFADPYVIDRLRPVIDGADAQYDYFSDPDGMKRRARGVVDYILLDPLAGARPMERIPNDIEDVDADGVDLFRYLKEYYPDVPVYFLDVRGKGSTAFTSLLANGGRGVVEFDPEAPEKVREQLETLSFSALVNNNTFQLGRSGKYLSYNCSQYTVDESTVAVAFDQLSLSYATASSDDGVITKTGEKNGVTFDDVIGCKEAKKELQGFCKFVADPRQLLLEGKKVPRGVLLYGPPGTGKTMLAKALANEAKAAFLPLTATTLFGSLVGESERNVRELFRRARRYAPSVIFIDEVDAIARVRTGSSNTAHNEDTLNAFIAEMDGFSTDDRRPVFILAATNYQVSGDGPRVLDPAFVRRFDRKIYVDLPDVEERFRLLQLTLSRHGVDFGQDHESIVRNLAERSSGMSNADLTVVVDMFLRACEDKEATGAELMEALNSFRFGEVNELDPSSLRETACHEAGHALIAKLLGETPAFLTVVARDNFGGFMEYSHDEKKATSTYGELMNRVCTALAGRVAEISVYGKDAGLNTGASSDISHARYLIKRALNDFAMGDKLYTAGTDEDCEKLIREQFERTFRLIEEHRAALDSLTDLLCARKSLDKTELEDFFRSHLQ